MRRFTIPLILTFVLAAATTASCYKDDSTEITELISDIVITPFDEAGYTVTSYTGSTLELDATIQSTYPADQLTCEWYLIDDAKNQATFEPDIYEREHIATGPHLSYEVNRTPGNYTIILEVQAANGYLRSATTKLHAVTNYSQGYYILKETAEGNTELDLFNPTTQLHITDILSDRRGQPVAGQPAYLSVAHSHSYIDYNTNEKKGSAIVTLTTQEGLLYSMRTSDLMEVFNRSNILFDTFADDEQPYRIVTCMWLNALVTNKGIRSQYEASMASASSGRYGITNGIAASPFLSYNETSSGLFFWDATTNSIGYCDYNGTVTHFVDETFKTTRLRNTECLHTGYCRNSDLTTFVLRNRLNDSRTLTLLQAGFTGTTAVTSQVLLTGKKLSQAISYSTCYRSASFLYGLLADGTIWALDLETMDEQQIKPAGIPADETITYVSDKTVSETNMLVVGTEKDGRYTLRFYSMLGGIPDGHPLHTISAIGKVKALHYTSADMSSWNMPPLQD